MLLQVVLAATLCLRRESPTCSCLCPTPVQALRGSQAVFVGTVRAVRVGPDTLRRQPGDDSTTTIVQFATARVTVQSGFKGPRTGDLEVTAFGSTDDGDSCGLRFEVGKVYLIYAGPLPWGRAGRLYASACGVCGSGPLARRAEAVLQLRAASSVGDTLTAARSAGRAPAG
jgi:hypothetical protein